MNTAVRVYFLHRNVCVKCDRILGTKQTQNCGNVQTFVSEYINVNTRGQFMTLMLCKCSTFETLNMNKQHFQNCINKFSNSDLI